MRRIALPVLAAALLAVAPAIAIPGASTAYAQNTTLDVIRGKVTGPENQPLINVTVKATGYTGGVNKTTRTDKSGKFSIIYPNGEGDYWVEFTAMGFLPKRFEVKRVADEEVLLADTKMVSNIATLDAMNVTANGPRALVNRNAAGANVGSNETALSNSNVSITDAGNLAALAAGIPGIQLIPGLDGAADVFSALGLSSDQNSTTFNGLGSGISVLPQDAQVTASVQTISYDPSFGNFSGGQLRVNTQPGTNFSNRQASSNAQAPQLEFADDVAEAQNQKYTNISFGSGFRGPIKLDRHFYNSSFDVSRNFKDLPSLLNTSDLGLISAGVTRDSVNRLMSILSALKIPASIGSSPTTQTTDRFNLLGNFDISPSSNGTGNGFTFGYQANYSRSQQIGIGFAGNSSILTTPAHNGESQNWAGQLTAKQSMYFWDSFLSTTNIGLGFSGMDGSPYLREPSGSVRINSVFDDSTSAVRSLLFGGNPGLDLSQKSLTAEFNNSVSWYAGNNRHALKLTTNLRNENVSADQSANLFGSYAFNSLGELETGQPASFTRTLFAPKQQGQQLTGAISLGDTWRPDPSVWFQYGLRADGNKFLKTPDRNPLLESKLGLRNDIVPDKIYLSPRFGFTWTYGKQDQIAFIPGAARPPRALIQGGIGSFQNLRQTDLLTNAVNNTGLLGSTQSITCNGPAAPTPSWSTYELDPSTIPTACADGTSGTQFGTSTPNVSLLAPNFAQARAWRTNLNWGGPILDNRFALGVSGVYSYNVHQADAVDANFAGVQRFSLDNEGGRPVYANIAAIDPRTGVIALSDTRKVQDFLRVSQMQSDLRSDAKQITVTLKPVTANPKLNWNLSYQFNDYRDQYRGFSSTVGDPFAKQWGQGLQRGRQAVGVGFSNMPVFDVVYVSWNLAFLSGQRYTPSISGDVNGDGSFGNDRAFVFNPALIASSDATLSAAMNSLLTTGAPSARKCLMQQLNTLASRGSCVSPWSAQASINMSFNPQKIGLPKRTTINLSLNNPLGLVDLIAHGNDIHGWGQTIAPDASLLSVRGFDPNTKKYAYDVNQRFGSTRPTQSTIRQLPLLALRVVLDIGSPRERQVLTQRLNIGRGVEGTKMNASNLKSLGSSSIPNPMALILQQPDSLKLTRKQADSLAALSRLFTQKADALWTPVSKELEGLPDNYSHGAAYDRYVAAREQTVDYLITLVPDVKKLLTASQKRKLPPQLTNYLDVRVLKFLRSSSSGNGAPFFIR